MQTTKETIRLRPVLDDDEEFLCDVYRGTRRDEVAAFGWDEAQQDAFLNMQFTARQRAYKMQFSRARHSIILFTEIPAGRIIVDRTNDRIVLIDIAVLPEYRGQGIATHLIRQLQDEATESMKVVVLRVDKTNVAARDFYERLGFSVAGETDILNSMEWKTAGA